MQIEERLYTSQGTAWTKLPNWAKFFIQLGKTVSQTEGEGRVVCALALPTRAYAAVLTALGVIASTVHRRRPHINVDEHFSALCKLRKGTSLLYRRTEKGVVKSYRAAFGGLDTDGNQPYVIAEISNNRSREKYLIPRELCLNITIRDGVAEKLPSRQTGHVVTENTAFERLLLGVDSVNSPLEQSQLHCLLVGKPRLIEEEATSTSFLDYTTHGRHEGTLQELIRIKRIQAETSPFRSATVTDTPRISRSSFSHCPFVVIFDGARGFLNRRDEWPSAHRIVLLDRTDPLCDDAASLLNQLSLYRSTEENTGILELPLPVGVELLTFKEAVHK